MAGSLLGVPEMVRDAQFLSAVETYTVAQRAGNERETSPAAFAAATTAARSLVLARCRARATAGISTARRMVAPTSRFTAGDGSSDELASRRTFLWTDLGNRRYFIA
jgi:hypothetical protein